MKDELELMEDRKLDAVFAVEVAGLVQLSPGSVFWLEKGGKSRSALPSFSTDANAVLPWLCKHRSDVSVHDDGVGVDTMHPHASCFFQTDYVDHDTPPNWRNRRPEPADVCRAAVIALIRAKRKN